MFRQVCIGCLKISLMHCSCSIRTKCSSVRFRVGSTFMRYKMVQRSHIWTAKIQQCVTSIATMNRIEQRLNRCHSISLLESDKDLPRLSCLCHAGSIKQCIGIYKYLASKKVFSLSSHLPLHGSGRYSRAGCIFLEMRDSTVGCIPWKDHACVSLHKVLSY